jgi:HK97 family phage major capsid protein
MGQSAKDFLKAEIDRKLEVASNITETAQKAARSLTADEKQQVETLLTEVNQFKSRVQEMDDNERIAEAIEGMKRPVNQVAEQPTGAKEAGSFGDMFVKSEAFQNLRSAFKSGGLTGNWTSGPVEMPNFFDAKATVTSTASPIVAPDLQPGINPLLMRRLTVADLLAQGTTDSSVVRYVDETANTNAAAAVAEGDLKPESTIVFGNVDEPVRKIATFLPITDEMLEDVAQLRSYLDGRLRLFVQHEEERQLLSGSGIAPNLRGLLNRTGIQTVAKGVGASVLDALYTAITNIRTNALVEPDGIVMHPTNWAAIRTQKDGNGQYYGGGPFTAQFGDNVWGLRVAVTSAIPVDTALIGAFGTQAQVFRRNGLTVEASNSHADFFQRNLTAVRAEERLALAVYRPAAFHTVTALSA